MNNNNNNNNNRSGNNKYFERSVYDQITGNKNDIAGELLKIYDFKNVRTNG